MIAVADSGGTKCTWAFVENSEVAPVFIQTDGYNPLFFTDTQIASSLNSNEEIAAYKEQVTAVYFYGAGVSSSARKSTMSLALQNVFVNAVKIVAEHDMLAAAIATCGNNAGIACILGTGSNSCYYNGIEPQDRIPALGHILGDEASGAWMGKELIRLFLYDQLDEALKLELIKDYGLNKELIFEKVYTQPHASRFLASVAPFVHKHRNHPAICNIIEQGMQQFFEYHVLPYYKEHQVPVHCIGSVGVEFADFFKAACQKFEIPCGKILRAPIEELLKYHLQN